MKEFDLVFDGIFSGISPQENKRKNKPGLLECHNLEPDGEDYILHSPVIDLNATGYDWGNPEDTPYSLWQDNENDVWQDNATDTFEDD